MPSGTIKPKFHCPIRRDFAQMWIDALESGEYTQTHSQLNRTTPLMHHKDGVSTDQVKTPVGMCCLGVATDLAMKNGLLSGFAWDEYGVLIRTEKSEESDVINRFSMIPPAEVVRAMFDIPADDPTTDAELETMMPWMFSIGDCMSDDRSLRSLAGLNDSGNSFKEIAAFIRENML